MSGIVLFYARALGAHSTLKKIDVEANKSILLHARRKSDETCFHHYEIDDRYRHDDDPRCWGDFGQ
jgi:hypothetical protein